LEGVTYDTLGAPACEDGRLNGDFMIGFIVKATANIGVLAFCVFTDDDKVNVAGLLPCKG
jgi:hypothetical protein